MMRGESTADALVAISDSDSDSDTDLAAVGGRAVNLIRMAVAGLPVPRGFVVATPAYRVHVRRTGLEALIADQLSSVNGQDAPSWERASDAIRAAFA